MTNAPPTRKTHVTRILGANKNGDVLPDIWADVERIDEAKSITQEDGTYQGTVRRLIWGDDPDSSDGLIDPRTRDGAPPTDGVGNPGSRDVISVKVCSPDEADINDPEQWIPIDAVKHFRGVQNDKNNIVQGKVQSLLNTELGDQRIVEKRRVSHYDVPGFDDLAQAAFDADPTRRFYVTPAENYIKDLATKDDTQFIDVEIIKFLKSRSTHDTGTGNAADQGKQTKLLNQYLIDESDERTADPTTGLIIEGTNSFNPPYRLDPYENIVNVQLATMDNFFIVAGTDGTTYTSSNGRNWRDITGTVQGMFSLGDNLKEGTVYGATSNIGFARTKPGVFLISGLSFQGSDGTYIAAGSYYSFANMIGSFDGVSWFGLSPPNNEFSSYFVTSSTVSWGSHSKLVSMTQAGISFIGEHLFPAQYTSLNGFGWGAGTDDDPKNVPVDNGNRPVKLNGVTNYYVSGNGASIRRADDGVGLVASRNSGATWESVSDFGSDMPNSDIAFASGVFVAVGFDLLLNSLVQTSKDGFSWDTTLETAPDPPGDPSFGHALSILTTGKIKKD